MLMSLPSEGQSLSANQISSIYLHWRLRYNYFRFRNTNVRHIGILVPVSFSTIFRNRRVIPHPAAEFRPNRSTHCGNMTSCLFLKMAAVTGKCYFRFRICWCHCLQNVEIYQQTKFRRDISIGRWDITQLNSTSGLEIQTSAILESTSGLDLDQFAVICMLFCIRLPKFVQIGSPIAKIWRHIYFSRRRPLL